MNSKEFVQTLDSQRLKFGTLEPLVFSSQSNFLNVLTSKADSQVFANLEYDWKDRTLMNATHFVREIITSVERRIAMGLKSGEDFVFEDEGIKIRAIKLENNTSGDI